MRTQLAAALALALALALAAACGSSGPPPPAPPALPAPSAPAPAAAARFDPAVLDAWVDREVAPRVPSAVIALVDPSGVRWHRSAGSRDARGGPPPDRTTSYRIGSITKVLTGVALLQLRDAGALTLDDPVVRWVPELTALGASRPPVTIRHLVTHTSGIPSLGDGSAVFWEQRPPDRAQLIRALGAPLAFPPGTKSEYSNAGMALAGEIVARAAGATYRDVLARRVLGPIGMRTAVWDRAAVPVERLAIGVGAGGTIDPPHWQLGAFESAGGLYASLDDMAALARFALGGAPQVLAPASLAASLADDRLPGPHGVAWIAGRAGDLAFATHTGSTMDYSASLVVLPERRLAAIVLAAGPDAELVECAAIAALRAAAEGTAPASCERPLEPAVRAAADAALARLRAVIAAPAPAAIEAAFDPAFLQQIPASAIRELAGELTKRFGACARHEIVGRVGVGVRARLHCERGAITVEIAAAAAAPHRITGVIFPDR